MSTSELCNQTALIILPYIHIPYFVKIKAQVPRGTTTAAWAALVWAALGEEEEEEEVLLPLAAATFQPVLEAKLVPSRKELDQMPKREREPLDSLESYSSPLVVFLHT